MNTFRRRLPGGDYRHSFEETTILDVDNLGYIVKFEADGYAPYTSRVIHPDEGQVSLDVQLYPAKAMDVAVLLPDGRPAAGADVGLISPTARLHLFPAVSRTRSWIPPTPCW